MGTYACPAILIAAPASGQGKTTVTSALARLHARQGRRVRVFKCGPDFLDPYWHTLASGAPVHQLDLWMTGEADCRARLVAAAAQADLIIVEGVMGLFDGAPSAADLAQRFGLRVLTVIDASSMAGTFGALAFGLQHYRPDLPWAGVLANRVASERHAGMLQGSVREPAQWLGGVGRNPAMVLPERHLGLTVASEVSDALERLDAAADALAATPLGQMSLSDLKRLAGRTVAVARDAAFCFIYAANLECLQDLGAELVYFSPLTDSALPECDAVWLPGGYPELHAARLAANTLLRDSLAAHVAQDRPVWAECGGMMVLFDTLVTVDGQSHALWGLLPGSVTMQKRLAALGPQQLTLAEGTLRGHSFHYSTCVTRRQSRTARRAPNLSRLPKRARRCTARGRSAPVTFMPGLQPVQQQRRHCLAPQLQEPWHDGTSRFPSRFATHRWHDRKSDRMFASAGRRAPHRRHLQRHGAAARAAEREARR